jgi:hypothetical protein
MAVLSVTTLAVKPDGFESALDDVRKVKAIFEKNGARNVRLLVGLVAGEATGTLVFTYEADDFAAQGAMQDKFFADPDGLALTQRVNTSAGPVTGFQSSIFLDVPL